MIEVSKAASIVVGANRKGQISGAAWTYLLPQLSLADVLCIGELDAPARLTLGRLAREVDVRAVRPSGGSVAPVEALGLERLRDDSLDLVVLTSRSGPVRRDPVALAHLRRALRATGRLYVEPGRPGHDDAALRRAGFPSVVPLRITPSRGAVRSAVPAADLETARYFAVQGFDGHRVLSLGGSSAGRRVGRALTKRLSSRSTGVLAAPTPGADHLPPRWLTAVAARSGVDVGHHRWGLWARGDYDSQKVVLFLFEGDEPDPAVAVKLTRHPSHNRRLENEGRALEHLARVEVPTEGRVPRRVFDGVEGGLAVLGESMVHGRSYASVVDASPDNPVLADAAGWLTELGRVTARPRCTRSVAEVCDRLVQRYAEVYRPPPPAVGFLESQVAAVAALPSLPLVFQHGDPGVWNLVVQPSGEVSFLDWEASDPEGLPLWDLFYFLRSAATHASRVEGVRGWMRPVTKHFFEGSALTPVIGRAVRTYVTAVGVPPDLVPPLFHLCWVHRALKEASRLPDERLHASRYAMLVRLSQQAAGSPALQSVLVGPHDG